LNRQEALELLEAHTKRRNIFIHMLAVEAIMRSLAQFLSEDEALWGLTGLLHDIDFDETAENPENHGVSAQKILEGRVRGEILKAIKSHNYEHSGVMPETTLEKALIASDALSGLIVACALILPSKKVKDVTVETVKKKFRDKDFARGADRNRIALCEELGISKERFFEIALKGIQAVSQELGI